MVAAAHELVPGGAAFGPLRGVPCRRDGDALVPLTADELAELEASASPAPGQPIPAGALEGNRFDDGRARMMRGRNVAAGAMKRESDQRRWGLTGDQCIERAGAARSAAARRKER